MSKGTASDKVAAHTVAIQDNPICGLDLLQSLVNMVKVGKKKECILVIGKRIFGSCICKSLHLNLSYFCRYFDRIIFD